MLILIWRGLTVAQQKGTFPAYFAVPHALLHAIRLLAELWTTAVLPQRDRREKVSWDCQEELFRQEIENADDIRLSVQLLRKCMQDKKTFCPSVKPG